MDPYAPPVSSVVGQEAGPAFRPQPARTTMLIACVAIAFVMEAVATLGDLYGTRNFPAWNDINADSGPRESLYLLLVGGTGLLYAVFFIATIVLFCMWAYRANKNARALGAQGMEFTPGWTVGWFFIPFANLFKPFQAIREVAKVSDPDVQGTSWRNSPTPPVIVGWWTFWLLNNVMGNVSMRMGFSDDPQVVAKAAHLSVWLLPLSLVSVLTFIGVIRLIERRQGERGRQTV